MPEPRHIVVIAGEASGDAHGADLARALQALRPDWRLSGCGGTRLAAAGQEQWLDLTRHAVVGLAEVARHYWKLRRLFHQVQRRILEQKPDAVIFIDYPGFNLRLLAALKNQLPGTRFIYFVSPQVWAWKANRVRQMERMLDLLLVILPFEKEWFTRHAPRLLVEWVGHPLRDRLLLDNAVEPDLGRIALMPGSRKGEISRHLPLLWQAARYFSSKHPGFHYVLLSPDEAMRRVGLEILERLPATHLSIESYAGYATSHLRRCGVAWVASGTASLECALLQVPPVVFYKVHPLTYRVARAVVRVKYISMVNLLADDPVVPELIQDQCKPEEFTACTEKILGRTVYREELLGRMQRAVARLGEPGAATRAAAAVVRLLESGSEGEGL